MGRSVDEVLNEEEFKKLLDASEKTGDPLDRVIIACCAELGMREGEVAHLRKTWLDYVAKEVKIPAEDEGWTPKTDMASRVIPAELISERAWEIVSSYLKVAERINKTEHTVYNRVRKVAAIAGISHRVFPHSLRATAGTRIGELLSGDVIALCAIMGWKKLSTGDHYVRKSGTYARRALARARREH